MTENNWREFRFVRKGKADLVWRIRQDGESYTTQHGQLDGKMQEYSDTPGPKGKEGTKAYVDPVANCAFHMSREIRKKAEGGYLELIDGELVGEQVTQISFDKHLPKSFSAFKPQSSITDSTLEKLHKAGLARYSRKYDGFCVLVAHHVGGWEIYSRRMDLVSGHFPNHIKELTESDLPVGTLLIGEMLCFRDDGTDNFKATSRVCRSLEEEARQLVESGEVPEPKFIIFDCLFYDGKDLKDTCYDDRSKIWKENFKSHSDVIEKFISFGEVEKLICHVDYFDLTPSTWNEVAAKNKWEGFVVVDGSCCGGDKFYSFNGKPERPKGHYKLKTEREEDVVVFAISPGQGKRLGKVGALWLKQIDPETGKFVCFGKCGSGLKDEDVDFFNQKAKELNIPFVKNEKEANKLDLEKRGCLVIEVKFNERHENTNAFRHPVFLRLRDDKGEEECIANI